MTVERAMLMLRERWPLVALCLVLGLFGAGVASYLMPREYSSDVTLYVSLQGQAETSEEAYEANELAKERALSYAPLLSDERVTQPVIDRLGLGVSSAQLAERIDVTVEPETTVVTVAVRDATPEGAAAIADALAGEFAGFVGEIEQPIGPTAQAPVPGQPAPPPPPAPSRIGVEVIRAATPQNSPVTPDIPFNLALGAALGLLVGAGAMFVREARDTSVRSAAQLQELAPAPVLAEIAHDRRVSTRPLIVDEPFASPRAEAFRKLRTNLQFRDGGRQRVIVVTSARVGEGTSTTACNLAVALAEAGNRVLLVDANLRSPRVADYLGLDPFPGLADVLAGRMVWPYARQPWHRGGFDVVPAGPVAHDHSQLLASYGLADLLGDMRKQYHFIIVDTPALLAVSDAAAVAARADGVVLVVQHRQTSHEQVTAAVDALGAVSARLLGTVLTMTRGRVRRRARVPSYRTLAPRVRHDVPPEPVPAPREITSPPTGVPQVRAGSGAPRGEAGAKEAGPGEPVRNGATRPAGATEERTRPVDGWRPSPTRRS